MMHAYLLLECIFVLCAGGFGRLTFDIGKIVEGDFFIRFKLRHKEDDFKFNLISVYGPAQADQKIKFLV